MKIKVCGMRDAENIAALSLLKPDFMGFIFYAPSKRFVGEDFDNQILSTIATTTQKVGVFVNSPLEYVIEKVHRYNLNLVQLHGKESPWFCESLAKQNISTIKAFSVGQSFDFKQLNDYKDVCNYYLFDTETTNYGGSGLKFNWQLLEPYDNQKPFFLSGGIGIEDISQVLSLSMNIESIDINSRFEIEPALKNIDLLKVCFEQIREC